MIRILWLLLFSISTLSAVEHVKVRSSYYLADQPLSLEEVKHVEGFIVSESTNIGFTEKQCWLRLEITNLSDTPTTRVFEFLIPLIDHITLYQDGEPLQRYGQLNSFNTEMQTLNNAAFKIALDAHEQKTVYLEISSFTPIKTLIAHFNEKEYADHLTLHEQRFAIIYGMLLAMVLYNFFIWLMLREQAYMYYVLFHFVLFLDIISWSGFGFRYLWPEMPWINQYTYGIMGNLLYGLEILFIVYYLDTKKYLPQITRFLKAYAVFFVFLSAVSPFAMNMMLYEFFAIIAVMLTFGIIIYLMLWKHVVIAIYVFIAKLLLLGGNLLFLLSDFGFLKASFFIDNVYIFGAALEVILMSFALSYKYKTLEQQKSFQERRLRQTEEMLISKQRLSTIGENFNYLAHQFRQPLSQINSVVMLLSHKRERGSLKDELLEENLDTIESQTCYLSRTLDYFHNFTMSKYEKEKFSLAEFLEDINVVVNFMFKKHAITFETKCVQSSLMLYANPSELLQVLMIFMVNARDSLVEKNIPNPHITLEAVTFEEKVLLRVEDNGGEISPDIQNRIFEPYFSTKTDTKGEGLGLYIAKLIVENKMQSKILLETEKGRTRFAIVLNPTLILNS